MKSYLFIVFSILAFCNLGFGQEDQVKLELVQKLASSKPGVDRLDLIYQLAKLTQPDPAEQVKYIERLLQESEALNNDQYKCEAYLSYMFLAYNRYDTEEVNKWMKLLEPLARKEKLYDLLFRGRQCIADMLLIAEEYEMGEKEALFMLREAQKLDNVMGQISAYHSLAHVYMLTYRNDKAFEVLKQAIRLGPRCSSPWPYEEVLRTMTRLCENMRDFPNWFKYQQLKDSVITLVEKENPMERLDNEKLLNYVSYIRYYTYLEDWEQAARYLALAKSVYSGDYDVTYLYYYYIATNFYYMSRGEHQLALEEIEKALALIKPLSDVEYMNKLPLKAYALSSIGREKEALEVYKRAKSLKDSLSLSIIDKQAQQIEKSYTTSLEILDEEEQRQRLQLIFLILAALVTIALVVSIMHTLRVKRKLAKAEREMREMMRETEQVNQVKERLLSNINRSIRPPLEVIVDNSSRLASEERINPEEREKLSKVITSTANFLIKLINDILLLSKLESQMMRFTIVDTDLCLSLRSWVEIARMARSVSAYIPDSMECNVRLDQNHMQQVIDSLLANPLDAGREVILRLETSDASSVKIIIENTQMANKKPSQDIIIRNEINRMLVEHFDGKYRVGDGQNIPCVIITFNAECVSPTSILI